MHWFIACWRWRLAVPDMLPGVERNLRLCYEPRLPVLPWQRLRPAQLPPAHAHRQSTLAVCELEQQAFCPAQACNARASHRGPRLTLQWHVQ